MDRQLMLKEGKPCTTTDFLFKMVLDFNVQYRQVERIIRCYWNILKRDKVLGPVLPGNPGFLYKKAPTLKEKVIPGVIDPPPLTQKEYLVCFFACGRCQACRIARINTKKKKEFIGTSMENVIVSRI